MKNPRIYLAIDNCFASKRWTKPSEWIELVKSLGLSYIEASADNECDPLYTCPEYIEDWMEEIRESAKKTGVKVVNFYSGHGTYTTLGLGHTDVRIRKRILDDWLKPMVKMSGEMGAGLGFYCHAFSEATLMNRDDYLKAEKDLYDMLAHLAKFAKDKNVSSLGVEQMYSPHQIPWTIKGAEKLLKTVYQKSGCPFYITIDTGHQIGQRKFLIPSAEKIIEAVKDAKQGNKVSGLWLGSRKAYGLFEKAINEPWECVEGIVKEIGEEVDLCQQLFAEYDDGDTYCWLEKLACYSPIIHLQQTNGRASAHSPFTEEYNREGLVFADKVLRTVKVSYDKEDEPGMPPKSEELYLTLELFSGTADINNDILKRLKESIAYWRNFVPQDGMYLDDLLKRID